MILDESSEHSIEMPLSFHKFVRVMLDHDLLMEMSCFHVVHHLMHIPSRTMLDKC